ncbi:hypothetical protein BR93DRAFT_925507 [Coniochaeta sp. PMI_546]|nr:hypothetical protein BR93DRAFT_925507 [Coniochaeta sp. PMI_546]
MVWLLARPISAVFESLAKVAMAMSAVLEWFCTLFVFFPHRQGCELDHLSCHGQAGRPALCEQKPSPCSLKRVYSSISDRFSVCIPDIVLSARGRRGGWVCWFPSPMDSGAARSASFGTSVGSNCHR